MPFLLWRLKPFGKSVSLHETWCSWWVFASRHLPYKLQASRASSQSCHEEVFVEALFVYCLHQATARNLLQPFPNQLGRADIFQVATNDTAELYFFDINACFVEVDDMALQLWSGWRSCCTLKEDRPTISYVITPLVWVTVQNLIILNCLIEMEKVLRFSKCTYKLI